MCSHSSSAGPQYVTMYGTDPSTGATTAYVAEAGVPLEYAQKGITTMSAYQVAVQQELSDKQIQAQKDIAAQQQAFNQQQFDYQKQLADQQQKQVSDQAARQTEYDTGRAQLLQQGSDAVTKAFSGFNDDYFNKYASDYMSQVQNQLDFQRAQTEKQLSFGMARQGILDSQALANQQGLISETEGRALADQSAQAQQASNQLRANVANAKAQLLGQVQSAESVAPPIAAQDEGGVQSALQTQRSAISGVTNQAGDVTASLQGVPAVSQLGNIFAGVINAGGSYLQGAQSGMYGAGFRAGLSGTSPR